MRGFIKHVDSKLFANLHGIYYYSMVESKVLGPNRYMKPFATRRNLLHILQFSPIFSRRLDACISVLDPPAWRRSISNAFTDRCPKEQWSVFSLCSVYMSNGTTPGVHRYIKNSFPEPADGFL